MFVETKTMKQRAIFAKFKIKTDFSHGYLKNFNHVNFKEL